MFEMFFEATKIYCSVQLTALHFATMKGQEAVSEILLHAGADIMAEDEEGNT